MEGGLWRQLRQMGAYGASCARERGDWGPSRVDPHNECGGGNIPGGLWGPIFLLIKGVIIPIPGTNQIPGIYKPLFEYLISPTKEIIIFGNWAPFFRARDKKIGGLRRRRGPGIGRARYLPHTPAANPAAARWGPGSCRARDLFGREVGPPIFLGIRAREMPYPAA
jgi:hypothetical protein